LLHLYQYTTLVSPGNCHLRLFWPHRLN
jgi:hypothetical protein